jgi:alginate O-acetyltransferase complex protein AlgI
MKKIGDYALFILFFPQLISGPIIRIGEISSQIEERVHQYTVDNQLMGFVRFIIGLSKKILIANILGVQVDRIFALTGNELTTPLAWIGILAYAFQIYFDFSGYTDMAIGLARIMGFIFPENFNNPYVSRSITEFWRRWHITLSNWLRDYLFMPLNVKWRNMGKGGHFLSLIITFTLCGLWHNPGWTFIIWGAYQGVLLILDRLFLLKVLKKLGKVPSIIITFVLIVMGWVFFRAENLHQAGHYFRKLFAFDLRRVDLGLKPDFWVMLVIAAIFSFITAFKFGERIQTTVFEKAYNLKRLFVLGIISLLLFILCAGSITSSGYIPFIYFRF